MNAKLSGSSAEQPMLEPGFIELEDSINAQFTEAIIASHEVDRYTYFTVGARADAAHRLAVFCVADSIEPLGAKRAEKLRLAIPIERSDAAMPISTLGRESSAHYFYLTYLATRGGLKTLRVDPIVYEKRFNGRNRPPVKDLAAKIATFTVIPMREMDLSDGLTE